MPPCYSLQINMKRENVLLYLNTWFYQRGGEKGHCCIRHTTQIHFFATSLLSQWLKQPMPHHHNIELSQEEGKLGTSFVQTLYALRSSKRPHSSVITPNVLRK
eukprot:TRINITY_DN14864_c0_g1_i1.p1 TRINITY_DN14864_c0_g1~~TRINITY_DN14864_c0_g1_i1.p1  ORF type:complete len:103 (+),score=6.65 TRINITY_DN14864_c0_g1_i1:207-515(+)